MSTPFAWQGRIDAEENGPSLRWHQQVQPFAAASQGGVALIGFAVDEGVRRNGGRVGAAQGPQAIRQAQHRRLAFTLNNIVDAQVGEYLLGDCRGMGPAHDRDNRRVRFLDQTTHAMSSLRLGREEI